MHKERWNALDYFRGLAVLRLIIFHGFQGFHNEPWWMEHSTWSGYKIADLTTPMFLFSAGLAYSLSYNTKSQKNGLPSAVSDAALRALKIFCVGAFGAMIGAQKIGIFWGTLEVVGSCLLFSLPFLILFKPKFRIPAALLVLIMWGLAQAAFPGMIPLLIGFNMGGPLSIPALSIFVIIGSALSEMHESGNNAPINSKLWNLSSASLLTGFLLLAIGIPCSRIIVNPTFILISLGLVSAIFLCVVNFEKFIPCKNILTGMGRNSFFLYLFSATINQLFIHIFHAGISLGSLYYIGAIEICLSIGMSAFLHRKKVYVTL